MTLSGQKWSLLAATKLFLKSTNQWWKTGGISVMSSRMKLASLALRSAAVDETAAAFYSPAAGGRANSLADAAMRLEPNRLRRGDPAAFPEKIVESFWQRLVEAPPGLGDAWDASKKDEL